MKFNAGAGTIDVENDVELISEGHPLFGVVWMNPARMSGAPCFYGTRVPIKNLFDYLRGGDSLETFLEDFEGVKRDHAIQILDWWDGLSNGRLLAKAATDFDVMLTVDQNIKHQQNVDKLPMAVIVLIDEDNRFDTLAQLADKVEATLLNLLPKTLTEISDAK